LKFGVNIADFGYGNKPNSPSDFEPRLLRVLPVLLGFPAGTLASDSKRNIDAVM
jgi:hypothetical protein